MGRLKRGLIDREDGTRHVARLAELHNAGVGVSCWCNRCGHHAEATAAMLMAQLGPDFPVPEIGTRMRCSACGAKDVATRPAWEGSTPVRSDRGEPVRARSA